MGCLELQVLRNSITCDARGASLNHWQVLNMNGTGRPATRRRGSRAAAADRQSRRRASALTMGDCRALFHMPVERAAQQLGVSRPTIARVLRAHGFPRWPYRSYAAELRRRAQSDHRPPPIPPPLVQRAQSAPSAGPLAQTHPIGTSAISTFGVGSSVMQDGRSTRKKSERRTRKSLSAAHKGHISNYVTLQPNTPQRNAESEVRELAENPTGNHTNAGKSPAYVNSRRCVRVGQDLDVSQQGPIAMPQYFATADGIQRKFPSNVLSEENTTANSVQVQSASTLSPKENHNPNEQEQNMDYERLSYERTEQIGAYSQHRVDNCISNTCTSPGEPSTADSLTKIQLHLASSEKKRQTAERTISTKSDGKLTSHCNIWNAKQVDLVASGREELHNERDEGSRLERAEVNNEFITSRDFSHNTSTPLKVTLPTDKSEVPCRQTMEAFSEPESVAMTTYGIAKLIHTSSTHAGIEPTATSKNALDDELRYVGGLIPLIKGGSDAESNSAEQTVQKETMNNGDSMLTAAFEEGDNDINTGEQIEVDVDPSFVFPELDETIQEDRWAVFGTPLWAQTSNGEGTDGLENLVPAYTVNESDARIGLNPVEDPMYSLIESNNISQFAEHDLLGGIQNNSDARPRQVALNGDTVESYYVENECSEDHVI